MKIQKHFSLFALLFLAFFNINPISLWSADDDMVWKYNVQNCDYGILFKNSSKIFDGKFIKIKE